MKSGVNKFTWAKACARADTTVTAKAVGLCLMNYATARGTNSHPGHARIAKELRVSEKTVSRGIAALIEAGLIRQIVEGRQASRRNWASVYRLTMPPQIDDIEAFDEPPQEPPEEPVEPSEPLSDSLSANPSRTPREGYGPADIRDRPADISGRPEDTGVHLSNPCTSNPSSSVPLSPEAGSRPGATGAADANSDDAWMTDYPAALKAYEAYGYYEMGDCIAALFVHIGDECDGLDADENRVADGMLQHGQHPNAIINKIRKDRR